MQQHVIYRRDLKSLEDAVEDAYWQDVSNAFLCRENNFGNGSIVAIVNVW